MLRPQPAPARPSSQPAARAAAQPRPDAPASVALLFLLGWRIAKHHGPG